jgi:YD repeat-containing protein
MYDATVNPKTGLTAKLLFFPGSGNFQQLAPTIDAMSVDEQKDELTLVGFFGSVKGDVYMNDAPLTIKDWTIGRITCDLPRSGAGSSGDVNVRAGTPRQLSNTVQLTEWNGTITCTLDGKGSLKQEWVFAVRFRADVHDSRLQPHADPIPRLSGFTHNLTTNGSHTCSGIYAAPDGSYRETWSGSGSVPTFIRPPVGTPPGPVTGVALSGSFDPDRKWSLQIDATVLNGNQVRRVTYDSQGNVTSDTTTDEHAVWISVGDMIGSPYLATASTGFSIPGGAVRNQINADESMEITWSTMPAKNPPTANAARKVDRR